jgi:hypothetical protein
VFKSRLQEYAQKAGLPTPEYHTLKEGPSHEPVFKSTVLVNNTTYESLPGFFSRKAAEQSAAEVALMEIAMSAPGAETKSIPAVVSYSCLFWQIWLLKILSVYKIITQKEIIFVL